MICTLYNGVCNGCGGVLTHTPNLGEHPSMMYIYIYVFVTLGVNRPIYQGGCDLVATIPFTRDWAALANPGSGNVPISHQHHQPSTAPGINIISHQQHQASTSSAINIDFIFVDAYSGSMPKVFRGQTKLLIHRLSAHIPVI